MKIIIISAIGNNNQIGKDNKLLWNLPEDLEHFKNLTSGYPVIMGRKTFESLPFKLPNRLNCVITNAKTHKFGNKICDEIHNSLINAINSLSQYNYEKVFIIGGATIYKEAIDLRLVDEMYISEVNYNGDADTHFPTIFNEHWNSELISEYQNFKIVKYIRK